VFIFLGCIAILSLTDVKAGTHDAILKDHEDPSFQHTTATVIFLSKVFGLFIDASYQFLSMEEKRNRYGNMNFKKKTAQNERKREESKQKKTK